MAARGTDSGEGTRVAGCSGWHVAVSVRTWVPSTSRGAANGCVLGARGLAGVTGNIANIATAATSVRLFSIMKKAPLPRRNL